jgi:hypothetical protein
MSAWRNRTPSQRRNRAALEAVAMASALAVALLLLAASFGWIRWGPGGKVELKTPRTGRAEWVAIFRDLVAAGANEPGVLVTTFTSHYIQTRMGQKNNTGGTYPLGIAFAAEALGKTEEETERLLVEQTAHRNGAALALERAKALTARLQANTEHVASAKFWGPDSADFVMGTARFLAARKKIPLPAAKPSLPWVSVMQQLASHGTVSNDALYVVARTRRLQRDGEGSAGPLDHEEAIASLSIATRVDSAALDTELTQALEAAPLEGDANPAVRALALDSIVRDLPGMTQLENASDELGLLVLAKRAADGSIPSPPWVAFPEPPESARWRMGAGEDYLGMWRRFWAKLSAQERARCLELSPPPSAWRAWADELK